MLMAIDEKQPLEEQLGDMLKAKEIPTEELKVGDEVFILDQLYGKMEKHKVVGMGTKDWVNGHNVIGVPYMDKYGDNEEEITRNPNNYIFSKSVYVLR